MTFFIIDRLMKSGVLIHFLLLLALRRKEGIDFFVKDICLCILIRWLHIFWNIFTSTYTKILFRRVRARRDDHWRRWRKFIKWPSKMISSFVYMFKIILRKLTTPDDRCLFIHFVTSCFFGLFERGFNEIKICHSLKPSTSYINRRSNHHASTLWKIL